MAFLRNGWYMAGWAKDLALHSISMPNKAIEAEQQGLRAVA